MSLLSVHAIRYKARAAYVGLAIGDALGATAAGAQSTTLVDETRTEPARKGRAARAATRTAANPPRGMVVAASTGHALGRATSGARVHGAGESRLWTAVSAHDPVYRNAAQPPAGAITALAG